MMSARLVSIDTVTIGRHFPFFRLVAVDGDSIVRLFLIQGPEMMPLAIVENLSHTAAGRIGPILEGSCAGARWHGVAPLCTPGQGRHPGFPTSPTPDASRWCRGDTALMTKSPPGYFPLCLF